MPAKAKYPGWRTMTGAQRYNTKMERLFETAMALREWWAISDSRGQWWANDIGWVADRRHATRFNPTERDVFNLPMGDSPTWVRV